MNTAKRAINEANAHKTRKARKRVWVAVAVVFAAIAVCAIPFAALAYTSTLTLTLGNLSASSTHASWGDVVSYSASVSEPNDIQTLYVYFQSDDNLKHQVVLTDDNNDGVFDGSLTVDEKWSEGLWKCSAIQAYTQSGVWCYARDSRFYPNAENTDLSLFDVTIDENSHAVQSEKVAFELATVCYDKNSQKMNIDVSLYTPVSSLYVYYNVSYNSGDKDDETLQVQLEKQADSYHFSGSFDCSNSEDATWQCKAVQSFDMAGQTTYKFDKRFKDESDDDLSFLDALLCEHQWGSWVQISSSSCYEYGVEQRTCSLCSKCEKCFLPLTSHAWVNITTHVKPTKTTPGSATRICAYCSQTQKITLPALAPYSVCEYVGGIYLVRYYPENEISGCVMFRGEKMLRIAKEECWAILVLENPGELLASDFSVNASESSWCVARPTSDGGDSLAGDINNNGVVNVIDAQIAYDMALLVYDDFSDMPMEFWLSADVNSDGFLDALDARAIQVASLSGWNIS